MYRLGGAVARAHGGICDPDALQDGSERVLTEELEQIALGFGSYFLQDRLHPCVHTIPTDHLPYWIFSFNGLIDLRKRDVFG